MFKPFAKLTGMMVVTLVTVGNVSIAIGKWPKFKEREDTCHPPTHPSPFLSNFSIGNQAKTRGCKRRVTRVYAHLSILATSHRIPQEIKFAECVNEDWEKNEGRCFKKIKCSNDKFRESAKRRCDEHQDCWDFDRCRKSEDEKQDPANFTNPAAEVQQATGDQNIHDPAADQATAANIAQGTQKTNQGPQMPDGTNQAQAVATTDAINAGVSPVAGTDSTVAPVAGTDSTAPPAAGGYDATANNDPWAAINKIWDAVHECSGGNTGNHSWEKNLGCQKDFICQKPKALEAICNANNANTGSCLQSEIPIF